MNNRTVVKRFLSASVERRDLDRSCAPQANTSRPPWYSDSVGVKGNLHRVHWAVQVEFDALAVRLTPAQFDLIEVALGLRAK